MEFDKSKVYTTINAGELKAGSKGFFSVTLRGLKKVVESEDISFFGTLREIRDEQKTMRFSSGHSNYELFYLVEAPKEKEFRPYKDTDEMIEDFKKRYNFYGGWTGKNNPMYCPLIWLKNRISGEKNLITFYSDFRVFVPAGIFTLDVLFNQFTYLDGSPVGIEI